MINLAIFSDRLNEQLILKNVKIQTLAEAINVDLTTIYELKRGKHLPSTEVLFSLVEYFNCSADYLLGRIEFDYEHAVYGKPFSSFGGQFRKLLKETKTSQYALTKNMKISGNLIYKWLHDQATPSVPNLVKLAEYMELPLDVIIGRMK